MRKRVTDILLLATGAFLFALAINFFMLPNQFGEGGVTGITIILYYLFGWSPGLVSLIFNAVLLIIGYRFLEREATLYTIIVVVLHSLFLHVAKTEMSASTEPVVSAVFGGVLAGAGIGLIMRAGGTIAGSSIPARILNKYLDWNISYTLLLFDLIVVFCSYFIIGAQKVMLTIIMLYIATKVMNYIIEGLNTKKAVMIVSKEQDRIAEQVNESMHRGVTVLYGHGHYSKSRKEVLYIVLGSHELGALKKIVGQIDQEAFMTIHDVRAVFGNGFMNIAR